MGSDFLLALNQVDARDTIRSYPVHDWTDTVVITRAQQLRGFTVADVFVTARADAMLTAEDEADIRRRQALTTGAHGWTVLD